MHMFMIQIKIVIYSMLSMREYTLQSLPTTHQIFNLMIFIQQIELVCHYGT